MTEDEAKTKACHKTLAPVHDVMGGVTYASAPCIASACMAWRWVPGRDAALFHADVDAQVQMVESQGHPHSREMAADICWKNRVHRKRDYERTEGFCGLAGAPR